MVAQIVIMFLLHKHHTDIRTLALPTQYITFIYNYPHLHRLTIHLPLQPDFIFPFFLSLSTAYIRGSQSGGGWGVREDTVPFKWQESVSLPLPKRWLKSDPLLDEYQHTLNHRGQDLFNWLPVSRK